jgi:hypothetical protein
MPCEKKKDSIAAKKAQRYNSYFHCVCTMYIVFPVSLKKIPENDPPPDE